MSILGIQYFSVAVNDIEQTVERYERALGLKQTTEISETSFGFKNCWLGTDDANLIEVISPHSDDSALARFMNMRRGEAYPGGEGIYLVSLRVADVRAAVEEAEAAGLRVTTEPESPRTAWVHPATNGNVMIELNEAAPSG